MGMFLNSKVPHEAFKKLRKEIYFVDKTLILDELVPAIGKMNCYFCITRPWRFGKTVTANMVGAFFGKTDKQVRLFDGLAIAEKECYESHLNKHDIIYIDFSKTPKDCKSYRQYIDRIQDGMTEDLAAVYAGCGINREEFVWDALQKIYEKTENQFLFVIDEWDAVFHMPFVTKENQQEYLLFLRNMLKDQPYVEFVYMTGVLPIAKYSSGSQLNMFVEYDMAASEKFSEFFGFLDEEVDELYEIYKNNTEDVKLTRENLKIWYDGYYTITGRRLYNPRSIILALMDNQLRNYWTSSGPYDELFYYIQNNIADVRDELVLMVSGERVPTDIGQFAAASMEINSREQIYSAMVIYGLLTYIDGEVLIPNKELMDQYKRLLSKDSLGYVHNVVKNAK